MSGSDSRRFRNADPSGDRWEREIMSNIMKAFFTGRMARAPELKYTASGMAVANMSIVCNRSKKNGDEWEDEPNFFELVAFQKNAEHLHEKCVKGQKMTFDCEIKQDRWTDESGNNRSKVSFIVQTYEYGEKPRGGPQEGQSNYQGQQSGGQRPAPTERQYSAPAQQGGYSGVEDPNDFPDDIPF
jgi:single-strand DNA-binding protein